MSSLQQTFSSMSNPNFNELQWVFQIRKTLEEELEDDSKIPISIFEVHKSLLARGPESYTPQQVAIGPIRSYYHKYLEFNGETLGWMMAIDASFFLKILQVHAVQEGRTMTKVFSRMAHLVDHAGRKSAHHAILRDMVMLENQIPLFVLRKSVEFQFPSLECVDDMLLSMLMGLCKELCPSR
ncbi:hypothetical protein M0R45_031479 [Rubus argutus]|uniref:Uncharacterized protein n=1 Tax=Rubus argutus TaxID=59490 RepID=A0AAW1WGK1_RUBAR